MIFTEDHAQQMLDRSKSQTRRPVKPGEYAIMSIDDPTKIFSVIGANGRLKWQVGKDYAIQPGRGKKATGRTPPITAIRRERLQEILSWDLIAEGFASELGGGLGNLGKFKRTWNCLYRKPYDWESEPKVWVLDWGKNGGARQCGTMARR